jgi:hypothetical protein
MDTTNNMLKDVWCYKQYPVAMQSTVDTCPKDGQLCKGMTCVYAQPTDNGSICRCKHERSITQYATIGLSVCCSPFFSAQGCLCTGPAMCMHAAM